MELFNVVTVDQMVDHLGESCFKIELDAVTVGGLSVNQEKRYILFLHTFADQLTTCGIHNSVRKDDCSVDRHLGDQIENSFSALVGICCVKQIRGSCIDQHTPFMWVQRTAER